jgi:hypothetical protein
MDVIDEKILLVEKISKGTQLPNRDRFQFKKQQFTTENVNVYCQELTVGGVASSDEKWHFGIIKECLHM